MAKTRSFAFKIYQLCVVLLLVRSAIGAESLPLPIPAENPQLFAMGGELWRLLLALAIIIGLVFGLQWIIKRVRGKGARLGDYGSKINVIERKSIGQRSCLLLIKVGRKEVLLHQDRNGITMLCELNQPEVDFK